MGVRFNVDRQRLGTIQGDFFVLLCLFIGLIDKFNSGLRSGPTPGLYVGFLCLFIGLGPSFDSGQRLGTTQRPFLGLLRLYGLPVGVCQTQITQERHLHSLGYLKPLKVETLTFLLSVIVVYFSRYFPHGNVSSRVCVSLGFSLHLKKHPRMNVRTKLQIIQRPEKTLLLSQL